MLVATAGEPRFGALLLEAAQRLDVVSEVFAYRLSAGGRPQPLISCSEHADAQIRTEEYVARFYRNDPALWARRGLPTGGFVAHVQASEIALRDYRAICYDRPRFVDKLLFGWRDADGEIVLSFYRRREGKLKSVGFLGGLANIALTALARTCHAAPAEAGSRVDLVQLRLSQRYPKLSRREQEVCARTLVGRTAARIALELGVSTGTVLTYRQRAYAKLGVTAAIELVPALLN